MADAKDTQKRSASQHSDISGRSRRSQTPKVRSRKPPSPSYASSNTSSIDTSDKSLTSFPSFSPESPKALREYEAANNLDGAAILPSRKASGATGTPSIVESLVQSSPPDTRSALFDDAPLNASHIPGAIHLANDEFLGRIVARQGAVNLVRQLATDLAQRDAQIALLRRKAEDRERALRKIILECGISSLDLERKLRAIEEAKCSDAASIATDSGVGLEGLIHDAMSTHEFDDLGSGDATIRAFEAPQRTSAANAANSNSTKNWKDFFWGNSGRRESRPRSLHEDTNAGPVALPMGLPAPPRKTDRRSVLQNGIFHPPDGTSATTSSSASTKSQTTTEVERKPSMSLAAMALKLVTGAAGPNKDSDSSSIRGRGQHEAQTRPSNSSSTIKSVQSSPALRSLNQSKSSPGSRRTTVAIPTGSVRGKSPTKTDQNKISMAASYGPVEMDTILPFDDQPPTVTQVNNRQLDSEFLTDRFGFIYDQRRKKRQREAAESILTTKNGKGVELLTSSRGNVPPEELGVEAGVDYDVRPDTPLSTDEGTENKSGKTWQDYLKIATYQTELLSHTPSTSLPGLEVMEGVDLQKSPGITPTEDGFIPPTCVITPLPTVSSETSAPVSTKAAMPLAEEDVEPVKLLLRQLGEVHDSLQRDKQAKWNVFLRKVRAERKREGQAAATDSKAQRTKVDAETPEASIGDGELIGIASYGNKGKVGQAKWNEFKQLVLGGIPVSIRSKIWAECSGALAMRIPGYYDDLVANRDGVDDPIIVSQIKMDINRTLTDNIFFRRGTGVAKLEEVLLAYSRRNKEVGYCQGMNLITAYLLLIIPTAEDAFWMLASIIEKILPDGYYDHSLLASRADQQVLRHYVSSILPKLSAHLDDLNIELEALTFQWFLSVFTDCLSAEALFRVWDAVFCLNEGSTFLFQVALALLKLNEEKLLGCGTAAGVYSYINHQMTNHAISIDGLIQASEGLRRVVRREDVEARRAKAIEADKAQIKEREERNKKMKAERLEAAKNKAQRDAEPQATLGQPAAVEGAGDLATAA